MPATGLPAGEQQSFEYDAAGQLVRQVDFAGQARTSTYDALGRLLTQKLASGEIQSFGYTASGALASASDAGGSTSYTYDALDQPASITQPDGQTMAYERDLLGRVTAAIANGRRVGYEYDALGRLTAVHSPDTSASCTLAPCTTRYAYDLAGQRVRIELPNGITTRFTHDARGRVLTVETRNAADTVLEHFTATYSLAGRRLTLQSADGLLVQYTYDRRGQLVREQGSGSASYVLEYGYDAVGNRTRVVEDGVEALASYDANGRLLSQGGTTYRYDANGNRVERNAGGALTSYAWDELNQLTQVTRAGASASYGYDTAGRLVGRNDASGSTGFLVDPESITGYEQVVAERQNGSPAADYTWGASLLARSTAAGSRYVGQDPHGSTALLTDGAGAVSDTFRYRGYGQLQGRTGSSTMRHGYSGEMYDEASGAYYLRSRFYDPETGGFLSRDSYPVTAGNPASLPRYLYANADPVNHVDPLGQFSIAENSIVQSIQSSLMRVGQFAQTAYQGICKAKGTVRTVEFMSALKEFASGLYQYAKTPGLAYDHEKVSIKIKLPASDDQTAQGNAGLTLAAEMSYAPPRKYSFSAEQAFQKADDPDAPERGWGNRADGTAGKLNFGFSWQEGKGLDIYGGLSASAQNDIVLLRIKPCAVTVAELYGVNELSAGANASRLEGLVGAVGVSGKISAMLPSKKTTLLELSYPVYELKGDTRNGFSGTVLGMYPIR